MALQLKKDEEQKRGYEEYLEQKKKEEAATDDDFISISRHEPEVRTFKSQKRFEKVRDSTSYKLCRWNASVFDDLINIGPIHIGLDPFLGFFLPGFGDVLTQLTTVPAMYCALFELHSFPLFLACVYNSMKDWLVGLFPFLGDILDIFVRSNRANYRLLTGFVDDDPAIKEEVNNKALISGIMIVVLGVVIYYVISLIGEVFDAIF